MLRRPRTTSSKLNAERTPGFIHSFPLKAQPHRRAPTARCKTSAPAGYSIGSVRVNGPCERRARRSSPLDREAAIDGEAVAGDEVRGRAGQEHGWAGEVLRLAPAPGGGAADHAGVEVGALLSVAGHVGFDPARQDGVDL